MLYNELPIAFPWYDKLEQQDCYREEVQGTNEYLLISPSDALLPCQFNAATTNDTIETWIIVDKCTGELVVDLTDNVNIFRKAIRNNTSYFTYPGGGIPNLALPVGCYYSVVKFTGAPRYKYSENFRVPSERFLVSQSDNTRFTRLEWWNDTDLAPIFYNDFLSNGRPSLVNTVYLESYISGSDPEVEKTSEPDGVQEAIPTFQKFYVPYKILDLVSDSLKKALMLMQIHDHVVITTPNGLRSGEVKNILVTQSEEADYARGNIEIVFHENVIVKTNCSENMV